MMISFKTHLSEYMNGNLRIFSSLIPILVMNLLPYFNETIGCTLCVKAQSFQSTSDNSITFKCGIFKYSQMHYVTHKKTCLNTNEDW